MALSVSMTGDAELLAALRQLDTSLQAETLAAAALAGAQVVLGAAKENAPKRTGTLARSLTAVVAESDATHAVIHVGTNLIYAPIQEYGGTIHGKPWLVFDNEAGETVFVHQVTLKARPYLRPALDANTQKFYDETGRALAQLLNQVKTK